MIGLNIKSLNLFSAALSRLFFYSLILFLPTQLGLHFWPSWSFVNGLRVDYLSPTIYFTDVLVFFTLFFWFFSSFKIKPINQFLKLNVQFAILPVLIFTFYLLPFVSYQNYPAHVFKLLKLLEFYLLFLYIKNTFCSESFLTKKPSNHLTIKFPNHLFLQPFSHIAILLSVGVFFESFLTIFQFISQHSVGGLFYFFGERSFTSSTPGMAQAILNGKLILRPYGTFSHPNSLAGYFLAGSFLIKCLIQFTPSLSRGHSGRAGPSLAKTGILSPTVIPAKAGIYQIINSPYFLFVTYFLLLIALFISFSRSAWFVGSLLFLFIGLINIKKLLKLFILLKNKFLVFGLIFGLCLLIFGVSPFIKERLFSLQTTDTQSFQKRADLNRLAIKMFLSSPLVGVGLNNFIPNLSLFTEHEPQIRFYQPVHNIYLLILAESGILGSSLFLYIIYRILRRYSPLSLYLFISFITILLLGLFDHYFLTLQQNQLLFILIVGLAWTKGKK